MFKKLWGTKREKLFVLLILIIVAMISIFPAFLGDFIYWQDDIHFHVNRLESYTESVRNLDFFPRIFSAMGENFGYAADLFYPSIWLTPYALFRILGLSFTHAFYLYQFLISFVTAFVSYLFIKKAKQSTRISLCFSILYTLSTYRLIDQNVRGALGETISFIFLPIVFYGLFTILITKKKAWATLAVGMSCLLASHIITVFYTIIIVMIIVVIWTIHAKKSEMKRAFLDLVKAGVTTILLSAWFWIPYLEHALALEFNFSKTSMWSSGMNFSLGTLLLNSISNSGRSGTDLLPNFGIIIFLGLIAGTLMYRKMTVLEKFFYIATICLILFSSNLVFWGLFKDSFFAVIQFPWRLLIFVSFFGSILVTLLIKKLNIVSDLTNFLLFFIATCFLVVSFNANTFAQSEYNQSSFLDNENFQDFNISSLGHGKEYVIKDTPVSFYIENADLIKNNAYLQQFEEKHTYQKDTYELVSLGDIHLNLPKFYYLGYRVIVNGVEKEYLENSGLINIEIAKGENIVEVEYVGTFLQKISVWISLASIVLLVLMSFYKYVLIKKLKGLPLSQFHFL